MKRCVLTLFLTVSVNLFAIDILEDREYFKFPDNPETAQARLTANSLRKQIHQSKILQHAKMYMINGDLFKAKSQLLKLLHVTGQTSAIASRYWAIIHFIEGDYERTLQVLNRPLLQQTRNYKHICSMEMITRIILNKSADAFGRWANCYASMVRDVDSTLWTDVFISVKKNPKKTVNAFRDLSFAQMDKDKLEIILKLALYLNEGKLVIDRLDTVSVEALRHDRIRELIGMIYYRQSEIVLAYEFLEDLKTANAEVIKGNIYLAQGKNELALAQYRLAIKVKPNSMNAVERILPLSWKLEQWNTGLLAIRQINAITKPDHGAMLVQAAFETMKGNNDKALQITRYLDERTSQSRWDPLAFMKSYLFIQKGEISKSSPYSYASCYDGNPVMCWTYQQILNNPDVLKRNEIYTDSTDLSDDEWNSFFEEPTPIDEKIYISQTEIQELDDQLIKLK